MIWAIMLWVNRERKNKKSITELQKLVPAHSKIRLLSSWEKQLMGSHSCLSVPRYFQSDNELDLFLKWSIYSQALSVCLHYFKAELKDRGVRQIKVLTHRLLHINTFINKTRKYSTLLCFSKWKFQNWSAHYSRIVY